MTSRRDILKLGAAFSGATLLPAATAEARVTPVFRKGGDDYSHLSGSKRKAVPTACGQCPARCAAIGYVDAGHVVKMEGNPNSARSNGKLCPCGQAGINQGQAIIINNQIDTSGDQSGEGEDILSYGFHVGFL